MILLAKGWTIAVREISKKGRVKITIYFTIYFCLSNISVIWKAYGVNEYESNFVKNNPPGIALIVLQCIVVIWFLYAIFTTCKNIHKKIHFYQKFTVISLVWLIAIICIIYI